MATYEPDFYIPENIIGYTGVLSKNPTVYFLSKTHYGHITQVHEDWTNVGREVICLNTQYAFGNRDGKRLFEKDTARAMVHTSRSAMTLIDAGTPPPELTHAIMVHSERKARELVNRKIEYDVSSENVARAKHPGQSPTDAEREAVQDQPILGFWWTKTAPVQIPPGTRLYALSQ
jgi:hypothetical protein